MPGPWLVLDTRAAIDITCVQTFQISRNPEKATRVQGEVLAFEIGSKEPERERETDRKRQIERDREREGEKDGGLRQE